MRPGKAIKLGILASLGCLIAMLLAGCGNMNGNGATGTTLIKAPASQQVYRYGDVASDISTFDPAQATDQASIEAIDMVFTGLVGLDDNLQVQPQLAQSYTISSDGLTYTFHLRPHLTFSDGTPLTANDVAYSIDRALSPTISDRNGGTLTYLGLIKDASERIHGQQNTLIGDSIQVLNASTLELIVSATTPYFLQALSYPTAYVVEKSVIDRWGLKWTEHLNEHSGQGGDGPFKVQSYSHSSGIVFVPNAHYYGPQPQLQRAEFSFYPTPHSAFAAYQAGQVDFVEQVPPEELATAQALTDNQYIQRSQLTIDYIAMNYLYKPFDNLHIRQALALAVNKDVIADGIYHGSRTATCHIVPEGMSGYNPNLQCPLGVSTGGDPAKARLLFQQGLREEGLTLSTFPRVTITYRSNNPAIASTITAMRQNWKQVLGVDIGAQVMDFVQLIKVETATYCAQDNPAKCQGRGLQMWQAGWGADYPDPQDWTSLQFGQNAANNYANFGQNLSPNASTQEQLQHQMTLADREMNQFARLPMYNEIEQQLVDDVAWLPYDQRDTSATLKPYVLGKVYNVLSLIPPNDWGSIYIAQH